MFYLLSQKSYMAFSFIGLFLLAGLANADTGLPDFTELVDEHSGAVVNISTTKQVQARSGGMPPGMDIPQEGPLGDFLRRYFGEQGPGGEGPDYRNTSSLGSGFIVSKDGYVVTNHHVVREADEIIVNLSDRRELVAELIGSDPRSDIALLKIDADDLPVAKFGSSNDLKVGQWVLAIGSPFGFDHTVTAGIVSGKGRSLPNENYVPFIQTDVAINPGNSGGPLFNLDGEVVGINSQIYSRTGGYMGLSFAIPVEVAMNVVDQLKTTGYVSRGWLGVYIQEVTRELAESFGMDKPSGALVAKIMDESPALDADVKVGDVIVEFDGQEVTNSAALPPMVGNVRVGEKVKLRIIREGSDKTVTVKIGQLPESEEEAANVAAEKVKDDVLGMELRPLTKSEMEQTNLEHGLYVVSVGEGPARSAGIRQGDVLQLVNGDKVKTVDNLKEMVDKLDPGKFASILVQRPQGPQFLAMKIPEKEE
ncbi:MAG: DegQ family serine endoprotease [Pseudomonadota bacterium]